MKPFREIRIFEWRRYQPSTAGVAAFNVRRRDAAKIVKASGDVVIDEEFRSGHANELHGFFESTMGICRLRARSSGLFAVDIEWKPEAIEALAEDRFAFLVPAAVIEKGAVARVIGLALTNSAIAGWAQLAELLGKDIAI